MRTKSGKGPPLIYLPGMEGTGTLFYRQLPGLSDHFTVIPCALRKTTPFTYNDLVEDLKNILDEENIEKSTLVGESFGGTVALQFALKYPERVNHLVLVSTFPYYRRRIRLRLAEFFLPLAFVKWFNPVRRLIFRVILTSERVDREGVDRLIATSFSHGYDASLQRLKLIREIDLRHRLSEIQVPATLIAGRRDRVVPSVKEARFMAERMPNAQVHVLPHHGHVCLIAGSFQLSTILCA